MSKLSRQFLGYIGTPPLDLEDEVEKIREKLSPAENQLLIEHLSLTNQPQNPKTPKPQNPEKAKESVRGK